MKKTCFCMKKFQSTSNLTEHNASSLDCKHKHMKKTGAPHGGPAPSVPRYNNKVYLGWLSPLGSQYYLNYFRDSMVPLNCQTK